MDLVVLYQAIDTSTASGRLLFNVLGVIGEFERDLFATARARPSRLPGAERSRVA